MSALGVGQKGENQKVFYCGHCLRDRMDRKRTAQGELKGEMEMQEWNLHRKGAACISIGLQRETPVPAKLQDALSLNSGKSRFYSELQRIAKSFRAKVITQVSLYIQKSHETILLFFSFYLEFPIKSINYIGECMITEDITWLKVFFFICSSTPFKSFHGLHPNAQAITSKQHWYVKNPRI